MANNIIARMPRGVQMIGWIPPADGKVKLNTDEACKEVYGSPGEIIGSMLHVHKRGRHYISTQNLK
ncbi:hypothetical protein A2U01_0011692, partial [Trifolium medium]|nr:hypothetical protein [Trifolium medium]